MEAPGAVGWADGGTAWVAQADKVHKDKATLRPVAHVDRFAARTIDAAPLVTMPVTVELDGRDGRPTGREGADIAR
jgi:hypothetical protein